MAVVHRAEISPTKIELLAEWMPRQPWAEEVDPTALATVAAYRFDDPAGEVGVEVLLVSDGRGTWQVPLTYRGALAPELDAALITPMSHTVLGPRWVYDGRSDPTFGNALVGALLGGLDQAELVIHDGDKRSTRPPSIMLTASEKQIDPVPTDDIEWVCDGTSTRLRVGDITIYLRHRIDDAAAPINGRATLSGAWEGRQVPALLAYVPA